jgi:hypothetical protein
VIEIGWDLIAQVAVAAMIEHGTIK